MEGLVINSILWLSGLTAAVTACEECRRKKVKCDSREYVHVLFGHPPIVF
jgi:Fungal Zn(2)-Cys(6) binuclear cluster domain